MATLSPVQAKYLRETASTDGRRWAYTDEDRDLIDQLVRLGLLEPAPGECIIAPPRHIDAVELLGHVVPVRGRLLSLYRLTASGAAAIDATTRPH